MQTPSDWRTSLNLLARLKHSGDFDAWQEFVRRYEPRIRQWCRKQLPVGLVEEATADILGKLSDALRRHDHDPSRGRFRGWLQTVVQHAIADQLRELRRKPFNLASGDMAVQEQLKLHPDPSPSVEELVDDLHGHMEDDVRQVGEHIARLRNLAGKSDWEIYWSTEFCGASGAAVAAQMNKSLAAVSQARYRVKKVLEAYSEQLRPRHGSGNPPTADS